MRPLLLLVCAGVACSSPPTPEPTVETTPAPAIDTATPIPDAATPDAAPPDAALAPIGTGPSTGVGGAIAMVSLGRGYLAPMVCLHRGQIGHGDDCMTDISATQIVHGKGFLGTAEPGRYPIDCAEDEPVPIRRPGLRLRADDRKKFAPRAIAILPSKISTVVDLPFDKASKVTPAILREVRGALQARSNLTADQAFDMDLDGDGVKELVLAVSAGFGGAGPGGMVALVATSWQPPHDVRRIGPWRPFHAADQLEVLAATDLDGNGLLELIVWEAWRNDYYVTSFELGSKRTYRIGCGSG